MWVAVECFHGKPKQAQNEKKGQRKNEVSGAIATETNFPSFLQVPAFRAKKRQNWYRLKTWLPVPVERASLDG